MSGVPCGGDAGSPIPYGSSLLAQTAVDCLMLWKLTRVGEVGMDMARATRARMECLSCHRCHRFRTADRTWGRETEEGTFRHHTAVQSCLEAPSILILSLFNQKCCRNPAQLPGGRESPGSPCHLPGHPALFDVMLVKRSPCGCEER